MKTFGIVLISGLLLLGIVAINLKVSRLPNKEPVRERHYIRVVSLAPSMSETMVALRQSHRVVGVTSHCPNLYLAHAKRIGTFAEPNFEAILALNPDLVLAVPHVMAKNTLRQLEANNIEVFAHQPDTLADIKFINLAIATKLGIESKGSSLNQAIDKALYRAKKNISHIHRGDRRNLALIAVSYTPFVVAGKNTFASQIIEMLGFTNMADDATISWPVWPLEHLLLKPPSILIIASGQENSFGYHKLFSTLGLDVTKASMRLIIPNRPIFNSPSPAVIDDADYLSRLLQTGI